LFFFFQAEDGIRDRNVTGVQTCALPIYDEDIDTRDIDAVKNHIKFLRQEMEKSKVESLHNDEALLNDHVNDSARKIVSDSYIFPHEVKSSITHYLKIIAGEVKVPG